MINGHIDIGVTLFTIGQYALVLFIGYLSYRGLIDLISEIKDRKALRLEESIKNWELRRKLWETKQSFKELRQSRKPLTPLEKLADKLFPEEHEFVQFEEPIISNPISEEDLKNLDKEFEELKSDTTFIPANETISYVYKVPMEENTNPLREQVINPISNEFEKSLDSLLNPVPETFEELAKELTPEETEGVDIPTLSDCLKKDPNFLAHGEDTPKNVNQIGNTQNVPCKHIESRHEPSSTNVHKGVGTKKGIFSFFSSHRKKRK